MGLGIAITVNGSEEAALAEAARVEVEERLGATTSYRLVYGAAIDAGDIPMLTDDRLAPGAEIGIYSAPGGRTECLVRGPVHAQRIRLSHGGAGSTLEVQGGDAGLRLDAGEKVAVWSGVTDSDAVRSILMSNGLVPDIGTTRGTHAEDGHALVQRGSDLAFIRRLARRNGFLLWMTTSAAGVDTAHFRPPPLEGEPALTLSINHDPPDIQSLEIDWDVAVPNAVTTRQLDLRTKQTLDGSQGASPLPALGATGLAAAAGGSRPFLLSAPADDGGDLSARATGVLTESGFFIRARCRTTAQQVRALVRAPSVVELRGAGSRHSGRYLVAAVRHEIDATTHRMELELLRNAWGHA